MVTVAHRLVELFEEMEKLERAFNGECDHRRPAAVTHPAPPRPPNACFEGTWGDYGAGEDNGIAKV